MSLNAAVKKQIITEFGAKEGDTGSRPRSRSLCCPVGLHLTEHLQTHKHDHHSRRESAHPGRCSAAGRCSTSPRRTSSASVRWSSASASAAEAAVARWHAVTASGSHRKRGRSPVLYVRAGRRRFVVW
ncbi:hypothetical protein SVIOM342S_00821 [Streptomyces violaceorubidus]